MVEKCSLCGEELTTTFLEKRVGTTIRIDGKLKVICSTCQKQHKEALKEQFS